MLFERNGWKLFSIADVEVSVSFWFIVIMGFIAIQSTTGWLFALAIAVSVLIHEFGHAIPSKHWKLSPSILLHGFGGLCFHDPADSDTKDIIIVVAGPLLEIFVGLLAFGGLFIGLGPSGWFVGPYWQLFVAYFGFVSIAWGLFNLLVPIYPLDGGKLLLLMLRRVMKEHKAQELTIQISFGCAVLIVPIGFYFGFWFIAFLGAFIALDNWNIMQSGTAVIDRKAKIRASDFVTQTLKEAEVAYADEDWREAARLCHVLRASNDQIPKKQMSRMWEILSVSTVEQEEYDEALGWLKKAPDTPRTREARKKLAEATES